MGEDGTSVSVCRCAGHLNIHEITLSENGSLDPKLT